MQLKYNSIDLTVMRFIPDEHVCSSWVMLQAVNTTRVNMTVVVNTLIGTGGRLGCGSTACIKPINLLHSVRV
jgi:hypothetical protein